MLSGVFGYPPVYTWLNRTTGVSLGLFTGAKSAPFDFVPPIFKFPDSVNVAAVDQIASVPLPAFTVVELGS